MISSIRSLTKHRLPSMRSIKHPRQVSCPQWGLRKTVVCVDIRVVSNAVGHKRCRIAGCNMDEWVQAALIIIAMVLFAFLYIMTVLAYCETQLEQKKLDLEIERVKARLGEKVA